MFGTVLLIFALSSLVNCDWVKLPQMAFTPKVNYKVQTLSSLSDLSPSSILANSDVLSSVFSYDSPKIVTSTTEMSLITEASYSQQTNLKKFFPSTVTSKTVDFKPEISDRIDVNVLRIPVQLMPVESNKKKVIYLNQTSSIKVLSSFTDTAKDLTSNQETEEEYEDDDDGVTIVNEDENLDSSDEAISGEEDEYEFDDYEPEKPFSSTTTTTTKAPRKAPPSKPQRRVIQVASMKAKPHNHLSFTSFLKFLKNIQETFATKTAKNINEKVNMLRKFRDKLLITVNQRIKSLWKTQTKTKKNKKHRTKRTLGGMMEHGGGMDFPSAEGALLSISFLTFAVFLIKLVLQVIQTIKMKKYAWSQMNSMTVDPLQQASVVLKRHRNARKASFSDPEELSHYANILSSIETLKV